MLSMCDACRSGTPLITFIAQAHRQPVTAVHPAVADVVAASVLLDAVAAVLHDPNLPITALPEQTQEVVRRDAVLVVHRILEVLWPTGDDPIRTKAIETGRSAGRFVEACDWADALSGPAGRFAGAIDDLDDAPAGQAGECKDQALTRAMRLAAVVEARIGQARP